MDGSNSIDEIAQQLEDLMKHYDGGDEPLCEELAAYHEKGERVHMIRHPLLYSVPHFDLKNRECNLRLKLQKEMLREAEEDGDFRLAVFLHERPHRFSAFMKYRSKLSYEEAVEILAEVWIDSENIWQAKDEWQRQLRWMKAKGHRWIDDQKAFDELPSDIEVFRGAHKSEQRGTLGFSWTTERAQAEWFSKRFHRGNLWVGIVEKDKVIGHLVERGESEIVLLPEDLFSVHKAVR